MVGSVHVRLSRIGTILRRDSRGGTLTLALLAVTALAVLPAAIASAPSGAVRARPVAEFTTHNRASAAAQPAT
jgi:hypothetical protein